MSDKSRRIDRRASASRNRIADAMIRLGQERPVDSLTVAELAAAAKISRSTFYAHFASLGDYLERSFGSMIEGHARAAGREPAGRGRLLAVDSILAHIGRAPRYVESISCSRYRPRMLAEGERRLAIVAEENLRLLRPDLAPARRAALATFAAGGFMGLLRTWMESGLARPADNVEADFEAFARALAAPVQSSVSIADPERIRMGRQH